MITGAQIRQARELLGWDRTRLSRKSTVRHAAIVRAENTDAEGAITVAQYAALQRVLEAAGVEFDERSQGWA